MANNVVGSLIVNLGLETARLKSDTDKAARHFNSFEKKAGRSLKRVRKNVNNLLGGLGGLAAGLSIAGFGAFVKSSINAADEISKLSTRLGASTEALSQYKHVAELSGVEFKTLTKGFQNMADKISDAAMGTGEAAVSLRQLNLDATALNMLSPDQQFEAIADAMQGITNQGDKVRVAMDLFGGRGVSLLQAMEGGADSIQALRKEADKLGLTLSKEDAFGAADANDALTRLGATGKSLGLILAKTLGPSIADIADWLTNKIPEAASLTKLAFEDIVKVISNVEDEGIKPLDTLGKKILGLQNSILLKQKAINDPRIQESIAANFTIELVGAKKRLQELLGLRDHALKRQEEFDAKFQTKAKEEFKTTADFTDPSVGAAEDPKQKAAEKANKKKLDALTLSLMTEEQRLQESLNRRQDIVASSFDNGLIDDEARKALMLQLETDFESKLTAITLKGLTDRQKFEMKSARDKTKTVIGEAVRMTQGVAQHSKSMFKINKAAGLASAVIDGYASFNKTMAAYPYPINVGLAALGAAATGAQINAIKSTSFSGGGGGTTPSSAGGAPTINDTPVESTVAPIATPTTANITILGGLHDSNAVRELIESINTELGDGVQLNVTVAA